MIWRKNFSANDFPLIYLITGGALTARNFARRKPQTLELIKIAAENKISLVQIREKRLSARQVFELAREAAEITRTTATKILINDRADIALAANADGVHLTARSLSARTIRRNFPENFIVGVSAHTLEEAANAPRQAADFVTFSPVFSTPEKGEPQGVEKLREVCERLKPFPVIALGGIGADNFSEVFDAGAGGFAAIRFFNNAENIRKLAADKHR